MEQTEVLKPRTLADLIRILHRLFAGDEVNVEEVQAIMEAYESDPTEWAMYAKFDQYRYTRNLVDQGNGKFNLMILCWGEGHGSSPKEGEKRKALGKKTLNVKWIFSMCSIHDHTNSHCFLKMLQGNLKETLFAWPDKKSNEMVKKSERVLRENQCAYINDSIGLHRVENISHTEPAVSLHLYSPPFDTCHAFDQRTGHKNKVTMTFHSKFGIRTPYATSGSLENN
ncbi:cysteine dioxygenase type 1 isoform X1 [Macaca thibetana thibetana]|nr:cysteine dioxygenase type 1 isoform X1 [Macaca fascicularis]XP_011925839.1 PREDICTED: cysteine dioxygenase type 1 isoform X1 [Cercocebus atys]XP_028704931.1 cysteine dioxygenase type 1 isoform X1 [Macaca mulatta]XP_050649048.1 cysteine dioxygenase type 1 isoform X1 [Macaca thibetana thibetana]